MVKFSEIVHYFSPVKVLVIGDFMLDVYTKGKIERISPEAPVPILKVITNEYRAGGAGNVVLNLSSLGAHVHAIGRVGSDSEGRKLLKSLNQKGVDTSLLLAQKRYPTTIKNRLVAERQQILRIDREELTPLSSSLEDIVINNLQSILDQVHIVAISDYNKGFLSKTVLTTVIEKANQKNIPVIVDPKGIDFSRYQKATIIKPNEKEAYLAANLSFDSSLVEVARRIFQTSLATSLIITRSSKGISLFDHTLVQQDFPVHSKEVVDVTGAGDTVLAVLAICIANGIKLTQAIKLANIAAGITVEHVGCAQVKLSDLAKRLMKVDKKNKIFAEEFV